MRWPPYKHVFFDCDSTLTTVEGIDVLADLVGKKWRVEVLTRAAMEGDRELEEVYDKRLQTVRPTRAQINAVRHIYKQNPVPHAREVIAALQALGHEVYIISGGLYEPVVEFGLYLGVPRRNIRAVDVQYNELSGDWWQNVAELPNKEKRYLDHQDGALTASSGKAAIVRNLLSGQTGRSILIGDGFSDLEAREAVDLFVGFGGVVARPAVQEQAPCFVHTPSLAPVLALASGPAILSSLRNSKHQVVAETAVELIKSGAISFKDERLSKKFREAIDGPHKAVHTWPN